MKKVSYVIRYESDRKDRIRMSKRKKYIRIPIITAIVSFYLFLGCPIRVFFGVCCPGCGMTRALFSLIAGNLGMACYYNVFLFFLPLPVLAFFFRKQWGIKVFYCVSVVFLLALLIYYIIRLTHGSEIAYFRPEDGLIYKFFIYLKGVFLCQNQ